jgi:hypothetical protein
MHARDPVGEIKAERDPKKMIGIGIPIAILYMENLTGFTSASLADAIKTWTYHYYARCIYR